ARPTRRSSDLLLDAVAVEREDDAEELADVAVVVNDEDPPSGARGLGFRHGWSRRRRLAPRQPDLERRAAVASCAARCDRPAVQLHERACDGEPDAEAAGGARARHVALREQLEDLVEQF